MSDPETIIARCHDDVVAEPILARVEGGAFAGHDGIRPNTKFFVHAPESGVDIEVEAVLAAQRRAEKFAWWGVFATEAEALERIREREREA